MDEERRSEESRRGLDVVANDVSHIKADAEDIKSDIKELAIKVDRYYLTIRQFESEFKPVRAIVYGMVGIILTLVLTAIIYLVVNRGGS